MIDNYIIIPFDITYSIKIPYSRLMGLYGVARERCILVTRSTIKYIPEELTPNYIQLWARKDGKYKESLIACKLLELKSTDEKTIKL